MILFKDFRVLILILINSKLCFLVYKLFSKIHRIKYFILQSYKNILIKYSHKIFRVKINLK